MYLHLLLWLTVVVQGFILTNPHLSGVLRVFRKRNKATRIWRAVSSSGTLRTFQSALCSSRFGSHHCFVLFDGLEGCG
jgi:hypothetical protein